MIHNWIQFNESSSPVKIEDVSEDYLKGLFKRVHDKHLSLWGDGVTNLSSIIQGDIMKICGFDDDDRLVEPIWDMNPKSVLGWAVNNHRDICNLVDVKYCDFMSAIKELEYIISFPIYKHHVRDEFTTVVREEIVEDCEYNIRYKHMGEPKYSIKPGGDGWLVETPKALYTAVIEAMNYEDIEDIKKYVDDRGVYLADHGFIINDIRVIRKFITIEAFIDI
jgi:hypothetical protein